MANQDNKNFVENAMNAQKEMVDTMVENTKKFTNGNAMVADTVQKGSEWYKNWLDNQKNIFSQASEKATATAETAKENTSKLNESYQNWFGTQMNWAKQMWEMNQNAMKGFQQQATNTSSNPMEAMTNNWNNWMSQMNNWTTGMNNMNNWTNQFQQFQQMNPFNMDSWKKAGDNSTNIFNQWYEMLNSNFADMQKNFQGGTIQDAYRNMVNVQEGFTRFSQMWAPMWKSIQEKTFNTDMYKQWINPEMYKDLMDKFFGFMPENSRQYMQNFTTMMQDGMKQAGQMGMNNFQQMRGMMPGFNASEMFGGALNGYNTWYNMMNNAVSPIVRMMTPNQQTKDLTEWNDIANRMMVYNIKNAELQYMIYSQGSKVMDQLAESVMAKIQNGEEISSMMALYQEWMNISDKTFVGLFESDTYSQLMAEVSAMQLRLRKDTEAQLEKLMVGVPVATRSEMDEMYKTIYELKKQVRQLEKMLELETEEETANNEEAKAKAKGGKKA